MLIKWLLSEVTAGISMLLEQIVLILEGPGFSIASYTMQSYRFSIGSCAIVHNPHCV